MTKADIAERISEAITCTATGALLQTECGSEQNLNADRLQRTEHFSERYLTVFSLIRSGFIDREQAQSSADEDDGGIQ